MLGGATQPKGVGAWGERARSQLVTAVLIIDRLGVKLSFSVGSGSDGSDVRDCMPRRD